MFDFKSIKGALSTYTSTLAAIRSDIDKTEQAIEDCLFAPVSKEDAKKAIRAWLAGEADAYRSHLADFLAFVKTDVQRVEDPKELAQRMEGRKNRNLFALGVTEGALFDASSDNRIMGRCLFGLLENEIWKALERALDAMTWQPGSLSAAERSNRLLKLREKLKDLKAKEKALLDQAQEVGITVQDNV